MNEIWFTSDSHFNHANILNFISSVDGKSKVRPEFSSVEEMNEAMIERWNKTISPNDKVYHMGDVGFGKSSLESVLSRLNGKKRLILGNHDYTEKRDFDLYFKYFQKIMESRRIESLVFTHRPILLGKNEVKIKGNVHGHIHEQVINDPRYLNLSVEQTNYTPVGYESFIRPEFIKRGIDPTPIIMEERD
jgi:calcineurin-like phosphoesterase family protein